MFVFIAIGTCVLSLYWLGVQPEMLARLAAVSGLSDVFVGDIGHYLVRLLLITLLLGVVPIICVRVWGVSLAEMGFRLPRREVWRSPLFIALLIICFLGGISGAFNQQLAQFYPFSKSLAYLAADRSLVAIPLHLVLYALFYYVPWELFFRGFLLLFLVHSISARNDNAVTPATLALIVAFQTILSTLLHLGHPPVELLAAIPFGLAAGYLTYSARSILPIYIVHFIAGATQDTMIIIRDYL